MKKNRSDLIRPAGIFGLMLLILGYLRYSIQEVMGGLNAGIMIAGGVLILVWIIFNFGNIRQASGKRSTRLGANTGILTLAVVGIIGFANFVVFRHNKRFDMTTEKLYSLSDQTKKIAGGVQQDIKVLWFDKSDDQDLHDRMDEYHNLNPRLTYERIDPQAKPEVAAQYKVTHMGELLMVGPNRTEHPQDSSEQSLTDALIKVTRESVKTICFIEGHGEKSLTSTGGDGYDLINKLLKEENYETKSLNLVSSNQVPADCSVIVEAGPKQPLFPAEAAMIGKFLDQGGKALLLLDPQTKPNLDDVLKSWNIDLGDNIVIDESGAGRLFGTGPAVPLVLNYGSHPITKDFDRSMTFFPLVRSVNAGSNTGSDVNTTELLKTTPESWATSEIKGNEVSFKEGRDKKGPISLGVAASKKEGDKEARLVVIGDSDFASNTYSRLQRNGDLFMNTVNWLAQDEDLISIRPKATTDRRITMTSTQQNTLFWLVVVLLPGAVIFSGVYIWWTRR